LLFQSASGADQPGKAAIATAHPLATQAGMEILNMGGNAFDAAVAISAALAVVEPYSSGLGGGGFWLLHRAEDGRQIMIDGRETAPSKATKNMYLDKHGEVIPGSSLNGPKAAAIPGVPAGLVHLNDYYGRLKLQQNLAPAIRYAKEGFPVTELYRQFTQFRLDVLKASPEAARIFLKNNDLPPVGHIIVQPELAETLKLIAEKGRDGFYTGPLAERMVQSVNSNGGIWSTSDLATYRVFERSPVITQYCDVKVISAPPPSSGGIAIAQMLGMLEHFDLTFMDNITRKHIIAESMRRAYRDRAAYLGDQDFVEVPVHKLLNLDYLEGLALSIDPERATTSEEIGEMTINDYAGADTTHFSVLDSEGNRVSATLSINLPFGSGFVPEGTGVVLNNEMDDFAIRANSPNAYGLVGDEANSIAPGKRPLSSMTPTFLETEDRVGILGTPGGSRIISMVLLGILDFAEGRLPASWVEVPRFHHQYLPDEIQFEQNGLTLQERNGLGNLGHKLAERNRSYGNMQAVLWYKPKALVFAASDPRGEGEAVVFSVTAQK
jgi:gamma-glutamyltranspeptidase/glutathione hydrolase